MIGAAIEAATNTLYSDDDDGDLIHVNERLDAIATAVEQFERLWGMPLGECAEAFAPVFAADDANRRTFAECLRDAGVLLYEEGVSRHAEA